MRTKEGAPSSKSKAPTVRSGPRNTVPHRATTTEVVVFHLIIAPLVLAVIVILAGLIWVLAAVTS